MITDLEKNKIFKNTKFFYTSTNFNEVNLKPTFKREYANSEDFTKALYSENTRIFFRHVITLKGTNFLNAIKNEFILFCTYNKPDEYEKSNWLIFTYNYIVNVNELSGFINKTDVVIFIDWYNETIKINSTNKSIQIEGYKNSFNPTLLKDILNFKNEDGTINEYHYLKLFIDVKNDLNKKLDKYTFESEYLPHLRNFNLGIEKLLIEIIKHYKNVLNFESSKIQDFKAYNYRDSLNYNQSLSFLKSYSNILINLKLQDKDINQLKNIQDYCINTLNQSLETLKTNFEIDVFNSPLKAELLSTKKVIKKAINKSDLKQPNPKNNATPQQAKNIKTDEVIKYNWFIIGLKFANGEMKALLKTHNNNATKIANELGNKDGFRPYISESIGVKKYTSEKSIYSDYNKMKTIIEYCKAEKTEIQSEFLMYFNKLEQEQ